MTEITPEVRRSRTIRECILQLLFAAHKGNPDVGVPHDQILAGFSTGRVHYTPDEIGEELIDLVDDGLIEIGDAAGGGPLPGKVYKITTRGRDFRRAKFPWQKIDEFTGGQSLT